MGIDVFLDTIDMECRMTFRVLDIKCIIGDVLVDFRNYV